jgi:predicted O-methyltransferase YrrM
VKPYEFTQDWTSHNFPVWTELLRAYVGRPIRMLEVGSFEGRSTTWFLDNVLTHPGARIVCVDRFENYPEIESLELDLSDLEDRFDRNVAGHAPKVTKIKGSSRFVLRELPLSSFDIAYIDGSHEGKAVLLDAVLAWDLVKKDGLALFDDYGGGARGLTEAIDAFLSCMKGSYELVHKSYQVAVTKTE